MARRLSPSTRSPVSNDRILQAIARYETAMAERLARGLTTQERMEILRESLDMEYGEYAAFQEMKTLAMAEGLLTLEEANTVYGFLGNTPDVFNRQPLSVKAVLTLLFGELIKRRLGR